ncbi:unnamed protein product [Paramecium pentaurelia]|uniref:Uncharacterized protein n=1 Tax=Paramecium pentaurelia TaxID=43138 RepID=A0A8S1YNA6_9CILI|nr:unnamed protein product [Paramecium pentaurelia]
MNCPHHPLNELSVICKAPYNCKRDIVQNVHMRWRRDEFIPSKAQKYQLDDDRKQVTQDGQFTIILANAQIHLKQFFKSQINPLKGLMIH